jgi:uncharacterized protein YaiI (UPF0178 family)
MIVSRIYVDADSCPIAIRDILLKAAQRVQMKCIFVAHQRLPISSTPWVSCVQVLPGIDAADMYIAQNVKPGDLVITQDIPLAHQIVHQGALGLSSKGVMYNKETIGALFAKRNLMEELRSADLIKSYTAPLQAKDRQLFASQLDKILTKIAQATPKNHSN